jgi:hypothetical protein
MPSANVFNPPPWTGEPVLIATLWSLTKEQRKAVCTLWNHPQGAEVRLDVDGYDAPASLATRELEVLLDTADEWCAELVSKGGWSDAPRAPKV